MKIFFLPNNENTVEISVEGFIQLYDLQLDAKMKDLDAKMKDFFCKIMKKHSEIDV